LYFLDFARRQDTPSELRGSVPTISCQLSKATGSGHPIHPVSSRHSDPSQAPIAHASCVPAIDRGELLSIIGLEDLQEQEGDGGMSVLRSVHREYLIAFAMLTFCHSWVLPRQTSAAERVFHIVSNQSSIAISGHVTSNGMTSSIQQQGSGSLTTSYSGTIRTDRGINTIQFLSGSAINANVSGNWQPLANGQTGSAPADYGGRVSFLFGLITANFAARNFVGDLTSSVLPVGGNGSVDLSTTTVRFTDGSLAFRTSTGDFGAESVVGESGLLSGSGSLTTQNVAGGQLETLSVPIDSSFVIPVEDNTTVSLSLTGQVVATAMLPGILPGDFNEDGRVDAADYVVWRNGVGSLYAEDDYNVWRANFGRAVGGIGNLSLAAVPEPITVTAFALAIVPVIGARQRRGRQCRRRGLYR
jgi:hypothetical protein